MHNIQSFGFRTACDRKHVRLILACGFLAQNKLLHCSFVRPVIISSRAFMYVLLTYNCTSSTRQLPIDEKNVGIRWRICMIGGFGYYILHLNFIKLDTVIVLPVVTITWIIHEKKRHAFLNQYCDSIDIIHHFRVVIAAIVIFRMR